MQKRAEFLTFEGRLSHISAHKSRQRSNAKGVFGKQHSNDLREDNRYQILTYADVYAGSGGCTTEAKMARLAIKFLLNEHAAARETLKLNHPNAKVICLDIYDFCVANLESKEDHCVDILHISYPYQPYSKANTTGGKNDQTNIAAMFSVGPLPASICDVRASKNIFVNHAPVECHQSRSSGMSPITFH